MPDLSESAQAALVHERSGHGPDGARQFDFWLGEWDVSWDGGAGTNSVNRILDGHVIQERFTAAPSDAESRPLHGISLSVYVPALEKWRQTWVDNTGAFLDFTGSYAGSRMSLATERNVDGKPLIQRMTFYNIATASLDWDWERSEDGAQSWTLLWRIH